MTNESNPLESAKRAYAVIAGDVPSIRTWCGCVGLVNRNATAIAGELPSADEWDYYDKVQFVNHFGIFLGRDIARANIAREEGARKLNTIDAMTGGMDAVSRICFGPGFRR